jgi:hypothetical protein
MLSHGFEINMQETSRSASGCGYSTDCIRFRDMLHPPAATLTLDTGPKQPECSPSRTRIQAMPLLHEARGGSVVVAVESYQTE